MNIVTNLPIKPEACLIPDAWWQSTQEEAASAFLQAGLPTRKNEAWKYTDVSYLGTEGYVLSTNKSTQVTVETVQRYAMPNSIRVVFVNGRYQASLSDLSKLPLSAHILTLSEACMQQTKQVQPLLTQKRNLKRFPFAGLNTALLQEGLWLHIPKNVKISNPIHILMLADSPNKEVFNSRCLITAEPYSECTVLEEYIGLQAGAYFTNTLMDIQVQAGAKLQYYKTQRESLNATHIAHVAIKAGRDSEVTAATLTLGARLSRDDVQVNLEETGAASGVHGFYYLNQDNQHTDHHVQIDHVAKNTNSDMVYKGILDKRTRAVFNGMIYVHKGAQKTVAHQANHNLLLSKEAEVDTKPEFEIYTDDVKCAHGDTVGQLNEDALFYLRARGIPQQEALRLLARAFAEDVLNKVRDADIAVHMRHLLSEQGL